MLTTKKKNVKINNVDVRSKQRKVLTEEQEKYSLETNSLQQNRKVFARNKQYEETRSE